MKILMINKFLYPKGGAETYVIKLGEYLQSVGHEVQYFGMEDARNTVGNRVGAYTKNMDFHGGSLLSKATYPFRVIYSTEARRKIRMVLDDFAPEVCHLNNFNYQLTPSIILEIRKWEKQSGRKCKIIYTAHDPQLVCPNHMCMNPNTHEVCEKCFGGKYINCVKGKCIHGSRARSLLGTIESYFWHKQGVYEQLDCVICCSHFMKTLLDTDPVLAKKTVALHNFVDAVEPKEVVKKDYVLYFGRYSIEKGIGTLLKAAKELPDIPFVFAGSGPLEAELEGVPNVTNVGFQTGEALETLIREARFTVIPSEWYENCPFSVLESISYGTPVLGANIGGIPELIRVGETGELFESGNVKELKKYLVNMYKGELSFKSCSEHSGYVNYHSVEQYEKIFFVQLRET
ncbi:MAG: glycosyltransferase [Oscillospiraceae bacterium]|nr:glycosyltransferase [Oscillospiraceae bacterium]